MPNKQLRGHEVFNRWILTRNSKGRLPYILQPIWKPYLISLGLFSDSEGKYLFWKPHHKHPVSSPDSTENSRTKTHCLLIPGRALPDLGLRENVCRGHMRYLLKYWAERHPLGGESLAGYNYGLWSWIVACQDPGSLLAVWPWTRC